MRGAAQPASRRSVPAQQSDTLGPTVPRMAASAVCESSRRRTLTYVKPKSRDNPCTYGANAGAVSRCCHSPTLGVSYACRAMVLPAFCAPTTTRIIAYCLVVFAAGNGHPCSCWRVVGLQLRRCVARPLAPRPTFRSYGDVRLRPQNIFPAHRFARASARFPREGRRRTGAFPLTLIYSFSMTGIANCHRRLSRALASVSKGPSVHSCTTPDSVLVAST